MSASEDFRIVSCSIYDSVPECLIYQGNKKIGKRKVKIGEFLLIYLYLCAQNHEKGIKKTRYEEISDCKFNVADGADAG